MEAKKTLTLTYWSMEERLPGLLLFFCCLLALLSESASYEIICQNRSLRALDNCEVHRSFLGLYTVKDKLSKLDGAHIDPYFSQDGVNGLLYQLNLEGGGKSVPLMNFPSFDRASKEASRQEIINFIKHEDSFRKYVSSPEPVWLTALLVFLLLFSVSLSLRPNWVSIVINKDKKTIFIRRINLFQRSEKTLDTTLVKTVDVQYKLNRHGHRRYRIAFILKDREVIPFNRAYSLFYRPKKKIATKLNDFLNIALTLKRGMHRSKIIANPLNLMLLLLAVGFIIAVVMESY